MTDTQLQSDETQPDDPSDKLDKNVLMVAGVVVLGAIMSILDITVVSVALKTFQTEFDATAAQVAWTMTGYTLALASVIPLTGWAADRFEEAILAEGADSVAAVFVEPVQNAGGSIPPPPG